MPTPTDCRKCGRPYYGAPGLLCNECERDAKRPQDAASDPLLAISEKIRTQDNRCTANPMFCVQVCERIGPIDPNYGNGQRMYHNHDDCETYYPDRPDPEEWKRLKALDDSGDLPENISMGDYVEKWFTVQVCYTEDGCKRHLELNGHNYRHYYGTRIYVESFHRNPEMLEIRKALLANPKNLKPSETLA